MFEQGTARIASYFTITATWLQRAWWRVVFIICRLPVKQAAYQRNPEHCAIAVSKSADSGTLSDPHLDFCCFLLFYLL